MVNLKPYTGSQRSLVLAIDFGTTFSGVAYSVLDPGQVPKIQSVTRFPGQETGDFKIPSVVCYRRDGTIRAAGAEARESVFDDEEIERDGLVFLEWFKLYLSPRTMSSPGLTLSPLPPGKSVVDVIADMLSYLFKCARVYIQETHANGASLWNSSRAGLQVVLSHPNGWEGSQQMKMRQAAFKAKLISEGSRLHFVTEGEASLHYCVNSGLAEESVKDGNSVMIVDCGGGTVDLTTYKFTTAKPIAVEETASPGSILQGSTRVNMRFHRFLQNKLCNSVYKTEVETMMERFEKSTKPTFNDPNARVFIKFGARSNNDAAVGIRTGQITIDGKDIESAFKPSVDGILEAIRKQKRESTVLVKDAFLVGGFAASPWLFSRLQNVLKSEGIDLYRPFSSTSKAVSEGAVSFYLTKLVATRIARLTYGVTMSVPWDPSDYEHRKRQAKRFAMASGSLVVPGAYTVFIAKGKRLEPNTVIRYPYCRESKNRSELDNFTDDIEAYHGNQSHPFWQDEDQNSYSTLCTIDVDTSGMYKAPNYGNSGTYYTLSYDIVLKVGLTELKAMVVWVENGIEKSSEARVIYYDS